MNTHIHSLNIETHVMITHIHFLNNHEMNTQIHFSDINNKEKEIWLQSVKLQSRTTFAQFGRFDLARQLRLAWFYFDPLGTLAPLAGLHRLISCPTTISSHNHYCLSLVLSARQLGLVIFLRSLGLIRLAPVLCSATCYGSLSYSLEKKNTVPAVLRTFSFLHRIACTAARPTSASLLAPCCGSRLYCASPSRVRQLGLAHFLCSLVSLRLTPALRSATSSNGSLSYSLEGIRVQSQQHTQ